MVVVKVVNAVVVAWWLWAGCQCGGCEGGQCGGSGVVVVKVSMRWL